MLDSGGTRSWYRLALRGGSPWRLETRFDTDRRKRNFSVDPPLGSSEFVNQKLARQMVFFHLHAHRVTSHMVGVMTVTFISDKTIGGTEQDIKSGIVLSINVRLIQFIIAVFHFFIYTVRNR